MRTEALDPLRGATIADIGARLASGTLTATDLTEACLERIALLDGRLSSVVRLSAETARRAAAHADALFAQGIHLSPLQGIPYAVKDIFDVAGEPTTCNSHLSDGRPAVRSAVAVERLDAAGAVYIGRLATHEFALGGPSPELPFPPARNPYNTKHFTGASSSGSGVAVAARLLGFALGSDTSGSIRGPAAACGICGLKPTFGLLSRRGVFPLSFSLDHIGPLARSVADCALVAQAMSGPDAEDPTVVDAPVGFPDAIGTRDPAGLTIGVAHGFLPKPPGSDPEIHDAMECVIELLKGAGAQIVVADLPAPEYFDACGRVLMAAESHAIHRNAISHEGARFGRYTYQRVAPGAFLSAADLVRAHQVRRALVKASAPVFAACDAVLAPSTLFPPPLLSAFGRDWPPPPELTATRTIAANVLGIPALSMPIGLSRDGLPIGMQVMGAAFRDAEVVAISALIEDMLCKAGSWNGAGPPL